MIEFFTWLGIQMNNQSVRDDYDGKTQLAKHTKAISLDLRQAEEAAKCAWHIAQTARQKQIREPLGVTPPLLAQDERSGGDGSE